MVLALCDQAAAQWRCRDWFDPALDLRRMQGKEDALRTAFIEMDRDGSGHLDPEELSECLARCGFRITKHQVCALHYTACPRAVQPYVPPG